MPGPRSSGGGGGGRGKKGPNYGKLIDSVSHLRSVVVEFAGLSTLYSIAVTLKTNEI